MTSNVGAKKISQSGQGTLGFAPEKSETADERKIREAVMGELKNVFRPEFLNRIDDIIVFHQLTQKDINEISPGSAGFDLDEMPWSKDTLSEDAVFMMKIIEKAKTPEVAGKLGYRPDLRIVSPWLDQFSLMIWKLDKDYLYGTEEKALVKQGIEAIQTVLLGKDSSAKRRLLFYLDQYLDPFYQNDLSELNEPLKALLQEVMNSDNEDDVIEEAHHLLEAYMEIE